MRQRATGARMIGDGAILQFTIDKAADPDRSKLRAALEAQFAYERMRAARSWFAHLLAILGVVFWLEAIWPDLLPVGIRFFALALFGGVLFLTLRTAIAEIVSQRKLKRSLAGQPGTVARHPEEFF
jgi:hypothetical protein